jgi:glycosyltransferase involved in cell wall biosynthesis
LLQHLSPWRSPQSRRTFVPKIAIVIPTYNHLGYALKAVETAIANTPDSLVIVVDDASPEWREEIWQRFPQHRLILHRFPKNDRNLTRSWNWGLLKARQLNIPITVVTNSDVMFPQGWSRTLTKALTEGRADLVGPATNAPGHKPRQQIAKIMKGYKITDNLDYLDSVQKSIESKHANDLFFTTVNGFCMAAKTDTWFSGAYNSECVFNPKHKMIKNEDELQGRWLKMGRVIAVCPSSFVWHYRSVTRKPNGKDKGSYRLKKGN